MSYLQNQLTTKDYISVKHSNPSLQCSKKVILAPGVLFPFPPPGEIVDNKVHPFDGKKEGDKKNKSLILVGAAVSLMVILGGIISAVTFALDGQTQSKGTIATGYRWGVIGIIVSFQVS